MCDFTMSQFVSRDDMFAAMRARIEELERELAEANKALQSAVANGAKLSIQLAAEKALADDFFKEVKMLWPSSCETMFSVSAYRKARGM